MGDDKHIVALGIDIEPIKKELKEKLKRELEGYIEEEVQKRLQKFKLEDDEVGRRLEKLEDWKLDIEQGYAKLESKPQVCKQEVKHETI